VGADGPATPISSTAAAVYADQTFNLGDYPPGDHVVIGEDQNFLIDFLVPEPFFFFQKFKYIFLSFNDFPNQCN
jgi:hypothetical protein